MIHKVSLFAACLCATPLLAQDTSIVSNVIYKVYTTGAAARWGLWNTTTFAPATPATFDSIVYRAIPEAKTAIYLVLKNNKWGLYSDTYKELVAPQYDGLGYNLKNNRLYVRNGVDSLYGILERDGKPFIPIAYKEILFDGNYYKITTKDKKVGMLDATGKELIPACFDQILDDKFLENSLLQVGDQWSVWRWTAKNPCQPTIQYQQIEYFNDVFLVKKANLWGIVDTAHRELLPTEYLYIAPFFQKYLQTLLVVKPSKKMGLIRMDNTGKFVTELPLEYDEVWVEDATLKVKARKGSKQDYIFEGKPYLSMRYNDVKYSEAINAFAIKKGSKWGIANGKGQEVIKPSYEQIMILDGKNFLVQKKGKWGVVGGSGQVKIPLVYQGFDYEPLERTIYMNIIEGEKNSWIPFKIR